MPSSLGPSVATPSLVVDLADANLQEVSLNTERNLGIDALRGLAVVFMIGANVSPYLVTQPYDLWFRAWTSTAAPIFVFLSGVMTGQAAARGRLRPWSHYAQRGLALFVIAIMIDVCCWQVTPVVHFDVLYLLACLQLLAPKFSSVGSRMRIALIVGIFAVTEPLQNAIGYRSTCDYFGIDVLRSALIDGWFPLFPWLGLGLAGTHLAVSGVNFSDPLARRKMFAWGAAFTAAGIAYWIWSKPALQTRMGYAELFYPPTLGFMACALGGVTISVAGMQALARLAGAAILAVFGRVALLIYIAHIAVIALVIHPLFVPGGFGRYVAVYAGLLLLMWIFGRLARVLCPKPKRFFARLLLG